jgi:N-methylhydantoinase A
MIRRAFETAYLAQYGVNPSHVPLEIVSWRLTATGPEVPFDNIASLSRDLAAPRAHRAVALWADAQAVPVFGRADLAQGQRLVGPAIIEERETTIVLPPGWTAEIDALGCIAASRAEA